MLRIAFFYLGQQGGGTALDASELAAGLALRSKVLCVVSSKSASYSQWIKNAENNPNLNIIGIETTKSYLKGFLSMMNIIKFKRIIKDVQKFCPDVVYSHMAHPWERLVIPFLNCEMKLKGIHDVKLHQGENTFFHRTKNTIFSYNSDAFVVFSKFSKEELVKKGVNRNRVITISLGCTNLLVKEKSLDLKCYNKFLFFGRLIKYKGLEIIFDSLDAVIEKHPDVKLIIAGRGDLSMYESLLVRYKDSIEVHNEWIIDADVEKYCKNVDFVVAPYIEATQSGVVVMAYSFGKPVIVSNCGGLPEQVVNNETGIVIPVGDSCSLSDSINYLYDHKDVLLSMKQKAYDYSVIHNWEGVANDFYDQIESMISK